MRELPISDAIGHMARSTMGNLRFALEAQWPWLVVLGVAYWLIGSIVGWEVFFATDPEVMEQRFEANPAYIGLLFGLGIVYLLAFSSVAVNWHRYVLLDEVPQTLAGKLRIDPLVWRYFGNAIGLGALLVLMALPFMMIGGLVSAALGQPGLIIAFIFAAFVFVVFIFMRWGTKFPAIALGRTDFRIRDAWKATDGNGGRLLLLALIFLLINFGVGVVIQLIAAAFAAILGAAAGTVVGIGISIVAQWVLTIMGITLYTSLYGFFIEGRDF